MTNETAPIILFAYDRPTHMAKTLASLARNALISESVLYVFCDGARANSSAERCDRISKVRDLAESFDAAFETQVTLRSENMGLASNVFDGVSHVVNKHGAAIVLEDDLLLSTSFLTFMNEGLVRFKDFDRVKQISGFRFPFPWDGKEAFLMPAINTIGWATWQRAWQEVDRDATGWKTLKKDRALRRSFNLDGTYNYFRIIQRQMEANQNDSWAILYWWSVFRSKGLILYPSYPLVQHNDFDNSGVHKSDYAFYDMPHWDADFVCDQLPNEVQLDEAAFHEHKQYLRKHGPTLFSRVRQKLKVVKRRFRASGQ